MKNSMVLVAGLLLVFLGSPLLAQEGPALPGFEGAPNGVKSCLWNEVVQATPVALEGFTPSLGTGMTARECREQSPCCACVQFDGTRCRDWQPC